MGKPLWLTAGHCTVVFNALKWCKVGYNMLFEMAIADAVGFGYEFAPPDFVLANNDGKTYVKNPGRDNHKPGTYSDDTQMSIAMAEWMLTGRPFNTTDLACHFVDAFKRDPREGYAGGFYKFLCETKTGYDFIDNINPRSNRAGGAMRAPVCGLLPTVEEVRDMAMWQASLTHATYDGMNAAAAAALLVWACRQGTWQKELPEFLNDTLPGYMWEVLHTGPVGNIGIQAVRAALSAIVNGSSLSDILVRSIALTGDVDTVAAIAIGAASMHPCITSDLDEGLYRNLEGGKYGWRYLKALDAKLMKAFPLPPKLTANLVPLDVMFIDMLDLFG